MGRLKVGDRLTYAVSVHESVFDVERGNVTTTDAELPYHGDFTTVVEVVGRSRALDSAGVERDAVEFRIERTQGATLVSREVCHMEPPLGRAVRWDVLEGGSERSGSWRPFSGPTDDVIGRERVSTWSSLTEYDTRPCDGYATLPRQPLWEGVPVESPRHLTDLLSVLPEVSWWAGASSPAVATTFGGSDALAYSFVLAGSGWSNVTGTLEVTLADGYPGAVETQVQVRQVSQYETREVVASARLVSYERGSVLFPDLPYVSWPERSPIAKFVEQDPAAFDDDAFGLPYRFADAMESLRGSGELQFARFLAENPGAHLSHLEYDAAMQPADARVANALLGADALAGPGWTICYATSSGQSCGTSIRLRDALVINEDYGTWDTGAATVEGPYEMASTGDLERLLRQAGIAPGTIRSLSFFAAGPASSPWTFLQVSQVHQDGFGPSEGHVALLDPWAGRLGTVDLVAVETR